MPILYYVVMLYLGFSDSEFSKIVSSRDLIWGTLLNYNPNFFEFVFGYGFLGQNIF